MTEAIKIDDTNGNTCWSDMMKEEMTFLDLLSVDEKEEHTKKS